MVIASSKIECLIWYAVVFPVQQFFKLPVNTYRWNVLRIYSECNHYQTNIRPLWGREFYGLHLATNIRPLWGPCICSPVGWYQPTVNTYRWNVCSVFFGKRLWLIESVDIARIQQKRPDNTPLSGRFLWLGRPRVTAGERLEYAEPNPKNRKLVTRVSYYII